MAPPKGFIPHNKREIDLEQMKRFYYEYKWDFKKIADFFGFKSKSAIYDRFKKLGLKARTNTDLKTGFKHSKKTKIKISESLCKRREPYIYRGYRMVRIGNKFKEEHIVVWEKNHGEKPKGYQIHHKDFNKLNNKIENLQILTKGEHRRLHNLKKKQNNSDKQQYLNIPKNYKPYGRS